MKHIRLKKLIFIKTVAYLDGGKLTVSLVKIVHNRENKTVVEINEKMMKTFVEIRLFFNIFNVKYMAAF